LKKILNVNLPFTPGKFPFYYGWVIVVFATIATIMSIPGQTMGVSVYTDHLIDSLGITRNELSLAYLLGTVASSLVLPYAGRLLDQIGARAMTVIASIGLTMSIMALASTPYLHSWFDATSLAKNYSSIFSMLLCALVFFGMRQFGQGQLTVIARTIIARWFEARRGLVMGVSGMFTAFGFGIAPYFLNNLIDLSGGWQQSLWWLTLPLVAMAIIGWAFFRDHPEECGLKPDGTSTISRPPSMVKVRFAPQDHTLAEAKKTSAFWVFNFGLMGQSLLITAVTFHIAYIGQAQGLDRSASFAIFLPLAIVATSVHLLAGYLSDFISLKYPLILLQAGLILGLVSLTQLATPLGYFCAVVGFATSSGLYSLLVGVSWPRFFGKKHLGSIAGYNMAWLVFGSALGPFLFSFGENLFGSFTATTLALIALPASVMIAAAVLLKSEH